jgi:hypothetical protein
MSSVLIIYSVSLFIVFFVLGTSSEHSSCSWAQMNRSRSSMADSARGLKRNCVVLCHVFVLKEVNVTCRDRREGRVLLANKDFPELSINSNHNSNPLIVDLM